MKFCGLHNFYNVNFVRYADLKNRQIWIIIKPENRKGESNEQVTFKITNGFAEKNKAFPH